MSDMNGQKSIFLNNHCKKKNISYLSFDFRGHGKSSGDFEDFGIGDWFNDLKKLIKYLNIQKTIIVGSSMGGWVAMLYALNFPKQVSKLIGIAPAPDFTRDLIWKELTTLEKHKIKTNKIVVRRINKDFSYSYSPKLFINSKKFFIGDIKKKYNGETILFHGGKDLIVPYNYNDRFYKNSNFLNLTNITIKNADHSMSDKFSLKSIAKYI
jgi:alpha-beta hydrolase superfamily lysophospholipase